MTGPIVAPSPLDVDHDERPLRLDGDVHPLPPMPSLPSAADLHKAAAAAGLRSGNGVPLGIPAGPTDAADVLDWLPGALTDIRRTLADKAAGGFLVTAADRQRHTEVSRIVAAAFDEIGRILAERA